jgi:hypothetical protein
LYGEKENFRKYLQNIVFAKKESSKNNYYLAPKCWTWPWRTVHVFIPMWCFCPKIFCIIRDTSHYGNGVERNLDKFPSRGQGRSPLKYTNYGVCISLKRKVWIFVNIVDKFSSIIQTLGSKTHKKCCHIGILEGVVFWPLAFSVKAEWTNFCSPPIGGILCLLDQQL